MTIDWDNPEDRAQAIQQLGPERYNEAIKEHIRQSVISTINGYDIRPVASQFGRLFMVCGTNMAFKTMNEAVAYAGKLGRYD